MFYYSGKVYDSATEAMPHFVNLTPDNSEGEDIIIDVAVAEQYILCVTEDGRVYSWGKNTGTTIQVINTCLVDNTTIEIYI